MIVTMGTRLVSSEGRIVSFSLNSMDVETISMRSKSEVDKGYQLVCSHIQQCNMVVMITHRDD